MNPQKKTEKTIKTSERGLLVRGTESRAQMNQNIFFFYTYILCLRKVKPQHWQTRAIRTNRNFGAVKNSRSCLVWAWPIFVFNLLLLRRVFISEKGKLVCMVQGGGGVGGVPGEQGEAGGEGEGGCGR